MRESGGRKSGLGTLVFCAALLAVAALPAEAAVTFVKSLGTAANATPGTTTGVTVPAGGAAAGNTIILTLSLGDTPGDVSAADTSGNLYSVASDVTNAAHVRSVILSAHNVSALAAGSTITITHPSVSASAMSAAEFAGVSKVTALDRTSSATGTGTSASSGLTAVTSLANELLIGAIGAEGPVGDAFTAGAGFTGLPRAGTGISLRGSSSGSANGSSLSVAKPAGVVASDVLLASVDVEGGSGTAVTASGWTLIRRDNSGSTLGQATYYKIATGSEPTSYSFGISSSQRSSGGIVAYTNVDNASPINASGGQVNSSSSSITAPSITTTAANTVLVGFFGIASNGTITPPADLSGRYGVNSSNVVGSAAADGFQAVAGATGTKVATCASSAVNIGHLVALTPTIPVSFATINPEYRIVGSAAAYQADGTLGASRDWAAAIATFRQGVCGDGFTDPGESCDLGAGNGAPDACCSATCAYKSSGTQCRAAVGECDQTETCSGSSAVCPADGLKAVGASCSSDGNACTKDQCDGASITCQHPAGNAGTVCRAAASTCDSAETCTGTDTTCPGDTIKASGVVCRASAGECDVAETCTGADTVCPADGKQASGTACTADTNPCTLDQCNGASNTCQHPAGNAGTVCRAVAGVCDVADTCTGTSTTCPTDAKVASGTVCRAAAGTCDVAESCTGSSSSCPTDAKAASGTVCRAATGECDQAETCSGSSALCPGDAMKSSGTTCTSDGNACTKDQCNGASVTCQHPAGNAGTVCRAAAGTCDVAETCTGAATTCPVDAMKASGVVCRASAGVCDVAETCTGTDIVCPADGKQASGTACTADSNPCTLDECNGSSVSCQHPAGNPGAICRSVAGVCDVAETCTGSSTTCPTDARAGSGTVCRPAAGDCDVTESCTGSSTSCPADTFLPATTLCRASTATCDHDEYCTASSASCPADTFVPGTTACFVQSLGTNGNENASTLISIPLTGDVVLGRKVIVTVAMDPKAGAVTCADNEGNVYSLDADVTNGSGTTGVRALAFSAEVTSALQIGDTITVSFQNSVACKAVSVAEFVGIGGVDQTAEATGDGISPSSGPTSPTAQPSELLLGVIGVETKLNQTFTGGAGYTVLDREQSDPNAGSPGRHVTIDPEFRFVTATGSYDADGTLGGPRLWAASIVTYLTEGVVSSCSNGTVEQGEDCDEGAANGTSDSCCTATCAFSAGGQVCRGAAGECDLAETCTGSSAACPADARPSVGSQCSDDGNPCTSDVCDGVDVACLHPAGNAGVVCRPATGECDLVESCDGAANDCPEDAFQAAGTECRSSTADCDPAESCTGTATSCPADDLNQSSEVAGVTLARAPSTTTIAWGGDINDLFNVYRGSRRAGTAWSYNQSCIETAVAGLSVDDTLNPGTGTVFYYLVSRVEGHCGESVLGRDSIESVSHDLPMVGQCLGPMVDGDGDGVEDALDNCPVVDNPDQSDGEQDDHGDVCDNCPNDVNPYQTDTDHDGIGDACGVAP